MRRMLLGLTAALLGVFTLAGTSQAKTLIWTGSTFLALGETAPTIFTGTGVATVGSGGVGATHLGSLRIAGGISGTVTTPLTDPDNATLVTLVATGQLGTGTFTGITGSPASIAGNATRPGPGNAKLCVLLANCVSTLPVPFTLNGTIGNGIGGIITVNTYADVGAKISVFGAPWTVGVATAMTVRTPNDAMGTRSTAGFVHGPASASSTAAAILGTVNDHKGGVIQNVYASAVRTNLNPESDAIFLRGFGRFQFIPEPGLMLLIGSGVAGLVLLGRSRMNK